MYRLVADLASRYSNVVGGALDGLIPHIPHHARRRFSALGVAGAFVGYGALGTAAELHGETQPVSMFANFVSSLGWGPNGSHEAFKYGLTAVGLLLIPYVLFIIARLRHHATEDRVETIESLTRRAASYWVPAVVGLLALSWFIDIRVGSFAEALVTLGIHFVSALVYFVCSLLGTYHLTRAMGHGGVSTRWQRAMVGVMVLSAIGMALSIVHLSVTAIERGMLQPILDQGFGFELGPEERVTFIAQVTTASPLTPFFEWLVVLSMLGWFAITGVQTFVDADALSPSSDASR